VSMPSVEWFKEQDVSYQEEVLPAAMRARVSVEAGITEPWKAFVGDAGLSIGINHYGASAAFEVIYEQVGITAEAVAEAAKVSIAAARG
jgi:transketolase